MITIYIKELDKHIKKNTNIYKIVKRHITKFFNIIEIKTIENNKKIYSIPNINRINIYKKINKKLSKEETKTQKVQLVLSQEVKKYKKYIDNYKIVDGRNIFLDSIKSIIEKILGDDILAMQDIYLTTDNYIEQNISVIKKLALEVKSINIITTNLGKYKTLEEIMHEQGIAIFVSNNKRKSLKRAKIIINLDFSKEKLNEYIINQNAIIINTTEEKITNIRLFEGIIIQDVELRIDNKTKQFIEQNNLNNFKQTEIYETMLDKKIEKYSTKVYKLYGNNGEISKQELKTWQKNSIENV